MNIFKKLAVTGLVLSMAPLASAASISGSTDFRVTMPEVLVLYHWDDAHLILTADNEAIIAGDGTLTTPISAGSYTLTGTLDTTGGNTLSNELSVKLENSWAVRSIAAGPVQLVLTNPNATLINTSVPGSTIVTKDIGLASTEAEVTVTGATASIVSGWDPVLGDITFNLNLANAKTPGEYNTRGQAGKAPASADSTDTFLLILNGL